MATTTFVDNTSIIYATWLNDVNSAVYNGTFISPTITPANIVCNGSVSGTGFIGLVNNTLSAPGTIGSGTPNTGAFTTLSASTPLGIASGGTALSSAGSAGNVLTSNGTVWASSPKITSSTAVASTSGTSIDFTGIPSWVKRVTVMLYGVSTNGSSVIQVQVGSGSVSTSGYTCNGSGMGASVSTVLYTSGFGIGDVNSASFTLLGSIVLSLVGSNVWVGNGLFYRTPGSQSFSVGGITLSGALDRIRVTTVNGTDAFDAGSINIIYE
jgi:hypothetical protein